MSARVAAALDGLTRADAASARKGLDVDPDELDAWDDGWFHGVRLAADMLVADAAGEPTDPAPSPPTAAKPFRLTFESDGEAMAKAVTTFASSLGSLFVVFGPLLATMLENGKPGVVKGRPAGECPGFSGTTFFCDVCKGSFDAHKVAP